MTHRFLNPLKGERGSVSVEAILMFPLLVWAYMGMYVFFEGLRESNINLKATYTIADLISRQENFVDNPLIDQMHAVYRWMSRSPENFVQTRISVVTYDAVTDTHELEWSEPRNGPARLVQDDIALTVTPHVPIMANDSQAIIVETWTIYQPIIQIGLKENTEIYNIVVTQPRLGKLDFVGTNAGTGTGHDDNTTDDDDSGL